MLILHAKSDVQKVLSQMLHRFSINSESYDDFDAMLQRLLSPSAQPIDAVLVDAHVYEHSGLDVLNTLSQTPQLQHIGRILIVSEHEKEQWMLEALRIGVQSLVVKPLNASALLDALLDACGQRMGIRSLPGLPLPIQPLSGAHILLVEDHPINRQIALDLLEDAGAKVSTAVNGQDAVQKALEQVFDLILMDIHMPVLDGLSATRILREHAKLAKTPIIAMTAQGLESDQQRCLDAGMNAYLSKPLDPDTLFKHLSQWFQLDEQAWRQRRYQQQQQNLAALQAELPHLRDLDLALGLKRVGYKPALYLLVLRSLVQDCQSLPKDLPVWLQQQQIPTLQQHLHSLKNQLRYLGADDLAQQCQYLEQKLLIEHPDTLASLLQGFCQQLQQLFDQLQQLPQVSDSPIQQTRYLDEKPKILVVDDERIHRQVLLNLLEEHYQVYQAASGQEALELLASLQPTLILLDVMMEDMDGFQLLQEIRQQGLAINAEIVFVSGQDDEESEERGLLLGACDFIIKPFNPAIVEARIRTLVRMVQQRHILENLAHIDSLTELHNRRKLEEVLKQEFQRCARQGQPLSVAIIDVDHFKAYNDRYGHACGDEVLRQVARVLKENLHRPGDFVARYGGEEFMLVLSATDSQGARQLAERLREQISHASLKLPQANQGITVSIGGCSLVPSLLITTDEMVEYADRMLYQAKHLGRNCVHWYEPEDSLNLLTQPRSE